VAETLAPSEVTLIVTSPPYPLCRKKAYANQYAPDEHVDWLVERVRRWLPALHPERGTLVLNLGVAWTAGAPAQSCWEEEVVVRLRRELGLYKLQRFIWNNPATLPAPAQWVTVERTRVKDTAEVVYAFGRSPHVRWDNRQVVVPYSIAMERRLAGGGESRTARRPSGHALKAGAFGVDHGGAIPGTVLTAANTSSSDPYQRTVTALGLPVHPARFPAALPQFVVKLCTQPDDLVWDPFGGSLQTAAVAEALGRRWVSNDLVLEYLVGGIAGRFVAAGVPVTWDLTAREE
jgi:hypothetical protein